MELKPIKTRTEYKAALREIEVLFDAPEGTPQADKVEVLAMLVEKYEARHHPIPAPDPIDFLNYVIETRGLTRKDLEPYIGTRGRVAEVLNRTRPLTLAMIRRLSEGLDLPADVLIADYELRQAA
ncbi:helix-turn-helix domain-containing protein [Candidatus Ferrigenium straubiae]|jgi:HTH-type transcriptional regulator/antitoxin HigA|uniref:helix-turn-helix domain-containing protein n=1 Tax=Candidatus Ferrigenium straubiae TaxID=2919506 RepID=UPI003F4A95C4